MSVQFSYSVVSDSLRPRESQHARPPCPSLTPGVHSNSCPSSQRCHPAISSSVVPFSSCPQSLPASGSFQMSQLFTWGGQSTGVSASTSVLPINTQDWSPSEWTGWSSLQSKGLLRCRQGFKQVWAGPENLHFSDDWVMPKLQVQGPHFEGQSRTLRKPHTYVRAGPEMKIWQSEARKEWWQSWREAWGESNLGNHSSTA